MNRRGKRGSSGFIPDCGGNNAGARLTLGDGSVVDVLKTGLSS